METQQFLTRHCRPLATSHAPALNPARYSSYSAGVGYLPPVYTCSNGWLLALKLALMQQIPLPDSPSVGGKWEGSSVTTASPHLLQITAPPSVENAVRC